MEKHFKSLSVKGHLLLLTIIIIITSSNVSLAQSVTLRINEFMALNQSTLADEDGEFSDWIEIYNPTSASVDLEGWTLTDEKASPGKWIFPDITLEKNSYLIVFASDKNRQDPAGQLHTNFKLSGNGEYFALINPSGIPVSEFDPFFPVQQVDISFGYYNNNYISLLTPTPGFENQLSGGYLLSPPQFSHKHGFYETPFSLGITCFDPEAVVYYSTNGSEPDAETGILYSEPLVIDKTSIIRAISVKVGQVSSKINTQTFLFLDDVIHQPNNPPGYPSNWGPYTSLPGSAIADYEMDPEIISFPGYADSVKEALLDIPSISLVTDKGYFFSHSTDPDTGGIYIYTGPSENSLGYDWERPVSFEYFDSKDSVSLQVDCGIQIQGGAGRNPEKSPKHSFRLVFKSIYGPSRLNYPLFGPDALSDYNSIILRARFNNSWIHWRQNDRLNAQYLRDRWAKDTYMDMGYKASHGIYVHLYINGMYWGLYNPSERMDNDFASSYLGGEAEDYDVIKDYAEALDGNITAWNNMMAQANAGLYDNASYQRIQGNKPDGTPNPDIPGMVDVTSLADYMLINFYGANSDWDHHNWVAIRNRVNPGTGFRFFVWDEEYIMDGVNENVLSENNDNRPSRVFQQLLKNEEFKRLFADRIQKLCFNSGALTPLPSIDRWVNRASQIDKAVNAESARWGDYRRDVHPWQSGPYELYTKQTHWLPQMNFMLNTYFPTRTEVFLNQLRAAGMFPDTDAPEFFINNKPVVKKSVVPGDVLTMTSFGGVIYYTKDGSDPVIWQSSAGSFARTLVAESAIKWVYVPKSDIGKNWIYDSGFSTTGWRICSGIPGGIGYEKGTGYADLITLDVSNDMYTGGTNPNNSCYVRIPFSITSGDISSISTLLLNIRYDDGFVAYLNGKVVASANAPASPVWNSAASGGHEAGQNATVFNISDNINDLIAGNNILAIHALNSSVTSTDFIINAELKGSNNTSATLSSSAILYSGPVQVNESVHINARTFFNEEWSASNEQSLIIYDNYKDIKITEIHYHPADNETVSGNEYEFIEIKNTGTSTLDMEGIRLIDGIEYTFLPDTYLPPKHFIVLASNNNEFYRRYGFMAFDEYSGSLDNSGERIVLVGPENDTLCNINYEDTNGWPETADGNGYSIVPIDTDPDNGQDIPEFWRASYHIGGSPGADDLLIPSSVDDITAPVLLTLSQNYPNPFSDVTHINYELYEPCEVELSVFDMFGKSIITLVKDKQLPGSYSTEWKGVDRNYNQLSGGMYLLRIRAYSSSGKYAFTRKMLLLR